SIRELLDCTIDELVPRLRTSGGGYQLPTSPLIWPASAPAVNLADLKVVSSATWAEYTVQQLENGTIQVRVAAGLLPQAKPALREIAKAVGVEILNAMGNAKNTRTL